MFIGSMLSEVDLEMKEGKSHHQSWQHAASVPARYNNASPSARWGNIYDRSKEISAFHLWNEIGTELAATRHTVSTP